MGPLINFLVLMVLLFAGLALPPKVGYGIAIPLAVATFILAIIRYSRAKKQ